MERPKKPWWMCGLEWEFWSRDKWELVHDGRNNANGQFELNPEEVRRFTRKYRRENSYVVFYYDLTDPKRLVRVQWGSGKAEHNKGEERFERV